MKQIVIFIYSITLCLIARTAVAQGRPRIANNNQFAKPGEIPYHVSIQQAGRHVCGGCLISNKHVLTAAHCFHDFLMTGQPISYIRAVLGTNNLFTGNFHNVDRISRHPDYSTRDLNADIAVVRLTVPVVESPYVKAIALPSPDFQLHPYFTFIMSGFGASTMNGMPSPYLKKLAMRAVPRSNCKSYWRDYLNNKGIFCTIPASPGGICQGDSGGPLTIGNEVVVGVASAVSNRGCGVGIPDIFTRVTTYLNFIRSEMDY